MASFDNQRGWAPLENIGDCSQGLCTMYCPQWCYVLFPPPPPFPFTGESDNSSGTAFSPLVIAIIGILATALLLISYYTVVNKYCGSFSFHRHRRHHRHQNLDGNLAEEEEVRGGSGDQANRQESWNLPSSNGLDEALISKITVYRYKRGEGLLNCTNCSVCLAEFREGDSLRLLPKCCHAFHLQCIDTWFKSHSNCPLCRANILQSLVFEEDTTTRAVPPAAEYQQETVVVVEDLNLETGGKQENEEENGGNTSKDFEVIEIEDQNRRHFRRSLSMGSTSRGRVSIAEVLQISMENEYMLAKDHWIVAGGGSRAVSSRQAEREHKRARSSISRGLHCVMSPVPMKRSVSSARSCFARQGRGRTSLLPV